MKSGADRVVGIAVAGGLTISALLEPWLPVYRLAVAVELPLAAALSYVVVRTVIRRTLPSHLWEPAHVIATHLAVFIVAIHVLVVSNLAGAAWARAAGPRAVVVLLGAFLATVGNLLPRVRPNLAMGIRTRQLLADPQRWSRVHRLAGHLVVLVRCAVGFAGMFLSGPAIGAVVGISVVGSLASLSLAYRRLRYD